MDRIRNRFDFLWLSKIQDSIRKCNLNSFEESELRSLEKRSLVKTDRNYYERIDGNEISLYLTEEGNDLINEIDCITLSDSYKLWNGKELAYVGRKIPEIL